MSNTPAEIIRLVQSAIASEVQRQMGRLQSQTTAVSRAAVQSRTTMPGPHSLDPAEGSHTGSLPEGDVTFDDSTGHKHTASGNDGSNLDHGAALVGLADDDHTQYALLAGRSGGQTVYGGTAAGDVLKLRSSSNATKGKVELGTASAYDEVNDRLGLGTQSPEYAVDALGDGYFGSKSGDDSVYAGYRETEYSSGNVRGGYNVDHVSKEVVVTLQRGNGTSFEEPAQVSLRSNASDTGWVTIHTANGGAKQERLRVNYTGDVIIGAASTPLSNSGKVLVFGDNTANPTMDANTAGLFAKDVSGTVEMFAVDEADNVTQLTSHRFELFDPPVGHPYPWSFYARNSVLGIEVNVDMAGIIAEVERLSGKKFMYTRKLPAHETITWDALQDAKARKRAKEIEEWELAELPESKKGPRPEKYVRKERPGWMNGQAPATTR